MKENDHLQRPTLMPVAREVRRLDLVEIEHLERCRECLDRFAQLILEVAHERARAAARKKQDGT